MTDPPAEVSAEKIVAAPGVAPPPFGESPARRWRRWIVPLLPGVLITALVFLVYAPLIHGGFIWDDSGWLVKNHFVHHWRGLWYIWFVPSASIQYYPLVFTAFLLQYKLWGLHAAGFHVVNIALQALNAILLWIILRKLGLKSAWLIAAIFAIHPVQVETVGWVAEQKNLISAAFYFAAVLAWIRMVRLDKPERLPTRSSFHPVGWYLLATLFFVLALLAKTDACTLPAVLLAIAWWKRGRLAESDINPTVPWFFLGFLMAAITVYQEHTQVGAHGPQFRFTLAEHLLIAGKDLWFYPLKLFWPYPLLEVYPRWNTAAPIGWQWIFPATALVVPVVLFLLHKKISRGPFAAVAFYGLTISPVLGFIAFYTMLYTFVADHYQYLACIGILALVVETGRWCLQRLVDYARRGDPAAKATAPGQALPVTCAVALIVVLGVLTWNQSELYEPPIHIWVHVLHFEPNSPVALQQVGAYECDRGHLAVGLSMLMRAYRLTKGTDPVVDSDLGDVYSRKYHNYAKAIVYYRFALASDPRDLSNIRHIVHCYERLGQWAMAFADLHRGLMEYPRSAALHFALANALTFWRQYSAAAGQYRLAVRYEPYNTKALYDLAVTLEKISQWRKAIPFYQRAVQASPQFALGYFEYGKCLLIHGRPALAAVQFRKVIRLQPRNSHAYRALARALQVLGHRRQAAAYFTLATKLKRDRQPHPGQTRFPRSPAQYDQRLPHRFGGKP